MQLNIEPADLAIIGIYFAIVFAIGFHLAKQTRNDDDLFLAGRRLGWFPISLSLFASNISSTTLIGLVGAAYSWGIAVANYEWMAAPILVVFSIVLIPLYLRGRVGTVPEYLERRFDQRARRYFSVLTTVSIMTGPGSWLPPNRANLTCFYPCRIQTCPGSEPWSACLCWASTSGVPTSSSSSASLVPAA